LRDFKADILLNEHVRRGWPNCVRALLPARRERSEKWNR
jgi:hypothetical protein